MELYCDIQKRIYENQSEGDTLIVNGLDQVTCGAKPPANVTLKKFGIADADGAWIDNDRVIAN